jgi:predicted nucleic acid-binding protein
VGLGVVLDTSFLVTLADPERVHHDAARKYWQHFLEEGTPVFLSVVVAAEFMLKQEIPPDILRQCLVLPFNWTDARKAAELGWQQSRPAGVVRDALKDDVKIIGQAAVADAALLITDDANSMYPYCEAFRLAGKINFKAIKLNDGFDRSFLNSNGQRYFEDDQISPQD